MACRCLASLPAQLQACMSPPTDLPVPHMTDEQAVALECMRGAHKQGRACYLYAFSGPQQCQELALDHTPGSMTALLDFLSFSFLGGTDVDTPFLRALDRLTDSAWRLADILLVRLPVAEQPTACCAQALQCLELGSCLHLPLALCRPASHYVDPLW